MDIILACAKQASGAENCPVSSTLTINTSGNMMISLFVSSVNPSSVYPFLKTQWFCISLKIHHTNCHPLVFALAIKMKLGLQIAAFLVSTVPLGFSNITT